MKERIIFQCEHCNKKRLINKSAMEKHEERCWWNTKNKTCVTCKYNNTPVVESAMGVLIYERECSKIGYKSNSNKPIVNCNQWEEEEY
ncbi:hypothetical protein [Clostridium sp. Marseille-Q2269]|uniref:hypothetical protein n=1 Tax=Clostridium sp. Marseille-Q2269 TaxID=2942205 RepID=UPI0020735C9E|nr:hypothetical protein [Clostridium sp. Marseille-Q2269]